MPGTSVGSCVVIAEIGQNHNGSVATARDLIDVAVIAGCNYVKFAKRTPEVCVPKKMWDVQRETPWGTMKYIDYRRRLEFDKKQYEVIDAYCKASGIRWFASSSDPQSVAFLERFDPPFHKIPSSKMGDDAVLCAVKDTGRPIIASTGMCSVQRVLKAVTILEGAKELWLAQCTSCYPCPNDQVNLKAMAWLRSLDVANRVGYSGHEIGMQITLAAVAMGAEFVERHITLSRASWGTDHAASLEPQGIKMLVRDIRAIEAAQGTGLKEKMPCEMKALERLCNDSK